MFVILETDSVAAVVGGKAVAAVDYEIAAAVVDRLTYLVMVHMVKPALCSAELDARWSCDAEVKLGQMMTGSVQRQKRQHQAAVRPVRNVRLPP